MTQARVAEGCEVRRHLFGGAPKEGPLGQHSVWHEVDERIEALAERVYGAQPGATEPGKPSIRTLG